MFYACVAIVTMVCIMVTCLVISIVDLEKYNFGLYIVLLCIVGIMLACALCIANPAMCASPQWCMRIINRLSDANVRQGGQQFTGSNIGAIWRNAQSTAVMQSTTLATVDGGTAADSTGQRGMAAMMMAPGLHVMNGIWKAMAWVAEDIEPGESDSDEESDDEKTRAITHVNPITVETKVDDHDDVDPTTSTPLLNPKPAIVIQSASESRRSSVLSQMSAILRRASHSSSTVTVNRTDTAATPETERTPFVHSPPSCTIKIDTDADFV